MNRQDYLLNNQGIVEKSEGEIEESSSHICSFWEDEVDNISPAYEVNTCRDGCVDTKEKFLEILNFDMLPL